MAKVVFHFSCEQTHLDAIRQANIDELRIASFLRVLRKDKKLILPISVSAGRLLPYYFGFRPARTDGSGAEIFDSGQYQRLSDMWHASATTSVSIKHGRAVLFGMPTLAKVLAVCCDDASPSVLERWARTFQRTSCGFLFGMIVPSQPTFLNGFYKAVTTKLVQFDSAGEAHVTMDALLSLPYATDAITRAGITCAGLSEFDGL